MSFISIVIPVFNAEKYLTRCINSVLAQGMTDCEILLIDDESTDNSGKICDSFSQKYKNIKTEHIKHGGCSVARNKGIDMATGEYLCFLDADDEWLPGVVDFIRSKRQEKDFDLLIFGAEIVDRHGNLLLYDNPEETSSYDSKDKIGDFLCTIKPGNKGWAMHYLWNRIYKRAIIVNNNIRYDENISLGEDYIFNCDVLDYVNSLEVINEKIYRYYKYYENCLTSKFIDNELERRDLIYLKTKELLEKYNVLGKCQKKFDIEEGLLTYNSLMRATYPDCKMGYRDTHRYVDEFLESAHYYPLIEYLKWDNEKKNSILIVALKRKNVCVASLWIYCRKKIRWIR